MVTILCLLIIGVVLWKPSYLTDNQHVLSDRSTMDLTRTNWFQFGSLLALTILLLLVVR